MTKVVVANRLVRDGKTYEGGDVIDVTPAEARLLISDGVAREYVKPEDPAKPVEKAGK
jgi:hypothetical protein